MEQRASTMGTSEYVLESEQGPGQGCTETSEVVS